MAPDPRFVKIVGRVVNAEKVVAPPSNGDDLSPHLMIVEWKDIVAFAGWETHEEVELPIFRTIGWLVYSDNEVVKLANTISEDDVGAGITAFPRGCIIKMEKV